jgi:hypothetical protein
VNCSIGTVPHCIVVIFLHWIIYFANPHLGDGADPDRAFKVEADPVQDRAFHVK